MGTTAALPTTSAATNVAAATASLPAAAPQDFAGTNPTPLDQPDATYPQLITSHVAVLQAIGTPEAVIAQLAATQPQAEYLDRYIQGEILQNPEGWDAFVGNPEGTARAGLTQLGIPVPAPGTGTAGYMPDGSPVSGIQAPGLSSPLLDPTTGGPADQGGGLFGGFGGLIAAAGVVGVGLLGWKFMKNRSAATEVASSLSGAMAAGGGEAAGGGSSVLTAFEELGKKIAGGGDDAARALESARTGTSLAMAAEGGTAAAQTAATMDAILAGRGVSNGFIESAGVAAGSFGMKMETALQAAATDRYLGVLELATKTGQLGDFAAAHVAAKTELASAASSSAAAQTNGILKAMVNAMP